MTTSHTADLPSGGLLGADGQFGLGFRISTDLGQSQTLGSTGTYGWSGIYGTNFRNVPELRYEYSYFTMLIIMAVVALGLALWFKWRGWY